jgi:hypothetical protein
VTVEEQLDELERLTTPELAARYEELHGKPPRTRHPVWMRKRIAYRIQEIAYGGLSKAARDAIDLLNADLQLPEAPPKPVTCKSKPRRGELKPGTVLTRIWRDQEIRVLVTKDGFEWNGERYGSLSAVANAVTGSRWSGRLFFGLKGRSKK